MQKILSIVILILIIIILIVLIWISVKLSLDNPKTIPLELYNKANYFIQDLCTQINEPNNYIIFFSDKNYIVNNYIHINSNIKDEKHVYEIIIDLMSIDLNKREGNKDIETTKRRLEQIAYNLNYLACTIDCSK